MNKPTLIIVTGRPGSGKTTLAHALAREIKCPLFSRDELKEGYVHTMGVQHSQLDDSAAMHIYDTFFDAVDLLIEKNISLIIEAAFQHHLWEQKLSGLSGKANIKVIICQVPLDLAKERFERRLLADPAREKFHGDNLLNTSEPAGGLFTAAYEPLHIDVPTLEVDTSKHYRPGIEDIIAFLLEKGES